MLVLISDLLARWILPGINHITFLFLLQSYEDWLVQRKFGDKLPPVLILDADQDIEQMTQLYKKHERVIRGLEPLNEQ